MPHPNQPRAYDVVLGGKIPVPATAAVLVSGGNDKTIKVRSLHTGKVLHTMRGHSGSIYAIVSSSNQFVVSGSWDSTIKVWSLHAVPNHDRVTPITDGQTLISGSRDETIRVWHLATVVELYALEGHQGGVAAVAISPDAQKIVSSSWDQTIRV